MKRGVIKMQGIKYFGKIAIQLSIAGMLAACAAPAPKLTKEQKEEEAFKTFHFYPDNRVGMKTKNETYWLGDNSKEVAIAIRLDTRMFNLVDVRSIRGHIGTGESRAPYLVTATLMDGKTATAPIENTWWVKCISATNCLGGATTKTPRSLRNGDAMNGLLKTSLNYQLEQADGKKSGESLISSAYKLPDLYGGAEIDVLHSTELASLDEQLKKITRAYDAQAQQRAKELAASKKQYEEENKRRTSKLRGIKIGTKTLCQTTAENLTGKIEDSMSLVCRELREESWVFEMRETGWKPIHVESRPSEAVGMAAAGFQSYLVTFQKIQ